MTMYIRVCVEDDVAAARQGFGAQVLGYAWVGPACRPGAVTGACSARWGSMRS